MQDFVQDFRCAWRMLRKNLGFASAAILMLALGIGANTAIFSLVSAAILRPLPFPEPGRLMAVWEDTRLFGLKCSPPAMGKYVDWRSQSQPVESMGALERASFRLTGESEPEEVPGSVVTASRFTVLRVKPALGSYGVLSHLVARRTREFGGCLALGARPADILSGVVRQCLVLAAAGITFGLFAALALTRAMTGILYGVSPRDPWTLAGSGAELLQNLLCRRW